MKTGMRPHFIQALAWLLLTGSLVCAQAGPKAKAVLVSDKDQTVTITAPGITPQKRMLTAGKATKINLERN